MTLSGWRPLAAIMLLVSWLPGCALPSSPPGPPLTATAVRHTLDTWNPNFGKVLKIYGFYQSGDNAAEQVAYVLLENPSDKGQKPQVFAARFQLLTAPEGQAQWFLVALVTPSSGLSRRQGWDNLMVAVKGPPPAAAK